jgi:hypothetical protein
MGKIQIKIVSKFLIGIIISICCFLIFTVIFVCYDGINTKDNIEVILLSFLLLGFLIYSMLNYYIELQDNVFFLKVLGIKKEVKYTDIKQILPAYQPGCYWINTTNNEMIFFMMPFCHKSLKGLFNKIIERNPNVVIDIKWFFSQK